MHPRGSGKKKMPTQAVKEAVLPLSPTLSLSVSMPLPSPSLLPCTVPGKDNSLLKEQGVCTQECLQIPACTSLSTSSDSCLHFSVSLAYSFSLLFSLLSTCQTGLAKRAWAWVWVCARATRSLSLSLPLYFERVKAYERNNLFAGNIFERRNIVRQIIIDWFLGCLRCVSHTMIIISLCTGRCNTQ